MKRYLEPSEFIDWNHPSVLNKAKALAYNLTQDDEIAKVCFEFVRDEIKHSWDYKINPVTCKASDVLKHQTGYCYAKSHLLAALLRANSIPSGLCYQRLSIDGTKPPFSLHGLNAIFLPHIGWYRIDARGNKEGVNSQFIPPQEKLAFPISINGEADLLEIWHKPLPLIIKTLTKYHSYQEVANHLPDVEIIQFEKM
jgi:transglutaminase-like putative cysteine protease